jgi:hypothetical protein
MNIDYDRRTYAPEAALAEAARVAGFAPSLLNTQPWRWHVDGAMLELYADPIRQLTGCDPGGRLMVLSCGAALHHARVALAAQGLHPVVERLAGLDRPRLLARLTMPSQPSTPDVGAVRLLETIQIRRADRSPTRGGAVNQSWIDMVRTAVEAEQSSLCLLPADGLWDLVMAGGATRLVEFDPRPRDTSHGTGDLGVDLAHARGPVDGRGAVDAILFGSGDTPAAWLYAGEALSAGWLTATELGVRVLPLFAAAEVDRTRRGLRRRLPPLSEPFLVLRFTVVDPVRSSTDGRRTASASVWASPSPARDDDAATTRPVAPRATVPANRAEIRVRVR